MPDCYRTTAAAPEGQGAARRQGASTSATGLRAADVELRRHFPLISDGENARRCVQAIVGWQQRPAPDQKQG